MPFRPGNPGTGLPCSFSITFVTCELA